MRGKTRRSAGGHVEVIAFTLVAALSFLGGALLVEAQSETIVVTSPSSDDSIHAGDMVFIQFENYTTKGVLLTGPFDIDLFKGANQVDELCDEEEGCLIIGGSMSVNTSSSSEPGLGYSVKVTDRNASAFGYSAVFELLDALSYDEGVPTPQYDEGVEDPSVLGGMSLSMMIVALVCGVAVIVTIFAVCCIARRRRKLSKEKEKGANGDVESGGGRAASSSNLAKGHGHGREEARSTGGSQRSAATSTPQPDRAIMLTQPSPGRVMAKGDSQRGRSLQRQPSARQMYRRSPSNRRDVSASASPTRHGYDSGGGGMTAGTPGMSSNGSGCPRTPAKGRSGPQRYMSQSSNSRWEEGGARMVSSKSPMREPVVIRPRSPSRRRNRRVRRDSSDQDLDGRSQSPYDAPQEWEQQPEVEDVAWTNRVMMSSTGGIETGRRGRSAFTSSSKRGRSPLRNSRRSESMPSVPTRHDASDSSDMSARTRSNTPSRQHYGFGNEASYDDRPADVSWEELRSTHIKSKARLRKSYALPSYGDAIRAESSASDDNRPPPPSYSPGDADDALRLSIGIPDYPGPSSFRAVKSARIARAPSSGGRRGLKTPGSVPSRSFNRGFSPGQRAIDARRAAKNAQLSAEKALAAAAMASRAADLAAQAALEAEEEADMDRNGGDESYTEMTPRRKSFSPFGGISTSSVREKIKAFSGGGSTGGSDIDGNKVSPASAGPGTAGRSPYASLPRGWLKSDNREKEVRSRAAQSSAKAREAVALAGGSPRGGDSRSGSGRGDRSWVKSGAKGVKGPDTAGGSASASYGLGLGAPTPRSSKHRHSRRGSFAEHHSPSGASDYDGGESEMSLNENANAAAAAIAATFGVPRVMSSGHDAPAIEGHPSPLPSNGAIGQAYNGGVNMSDSESPHPRVLK